MAVAARGPHSPTELPVEPSLDEVRELAREHNLVALRHSFIDDLETPVSAFLKLRGRDPQFPAFLLESAEQGQRVGRFSFIGVRPRKVVRWSLGDDGDPYGLAAAEVGAFSQAPFPDAPPFAGGEVAAFIRERSYSHLGQSGSMSASWRHIEEWRGSMGVGHLAGGASGLVGRPHALRARATHEVRSRHSSFVPSVGW
jgi:hypothetical protein